MLLNRIISDGGHICGGFVRDYLIRGESFNDIDLTFNCKWPEPYASWRFIRTSKGRETAEKITDGIKYHCVNLEPTDLTCNLFLFNGADVFPRPCFQYRDEPIDYIEAWDMLLQKKFVMQVPAVKNVKLRAKLIKRGWEHCGVSLSTKIVVQPPAHGPWSDFTLAKERFDAIAL